MSSVSALSGTCTLQGVTPSSIMNQFHHVVTVILTHRGTPPSHTVLIPAARACDPIKLIIKTKPLRSCRKWQAISKECFVHKLK